MRMGLVRPFVASDIPQVSELHRRVFQTAAHGTGALRQAYRSYFACVFLNHPWQDTGSPSLVYEDPSGEVMGFLGSVPRWMRLNGERVQASTATQFMVAPERRSTPAGLALVKQFLSGPQDLSFTDEANSSTRKLWEYFGGSTAFPYSIYWLRVLRPAQSLLKRMRVPRALAAVLAPLCWGADRMLSLVPGSLLRQSPSELNQKELDTQTLLACLSEIPRSDSLRPDYDAHSLNWLLQITRRWDHYGPLQEVAVHNRENQIVGWYLYHARRGGLGDVLQLGARVDSAQQVFRDLLHHAAQRGVAALVGRFDSRFFDQVRQSSCFFYDTGQYMMIHAKRAELLDGIHRGDALLTRLEGERCIRFSLESWGR